MQYYYYTYQMAAFRFFFRRISIVQNDVEKLIKKLYRDMANMQNKVSYFVVFFSLLLEICYNIMLM